jgi:hypothetical protein
MLSGLHRAAMSATQAISFAFFTKEGLFKLSPCITGEFIQSS